VKTAGAVAGRMGMSMAMDRADGSRSGKLKPLAVIGGQVATAALRPVTGAASAAMAAGADLERRAVDRVLDGPELERLLISAVNDERIQTAVRRTLESDGAKRLVDSLSESGLLDRIIDRMVSSGALWRLVDEVAASPEVKAAVSQQGLGYVDQVGTFVRERSRMADNRVEQLADRLTRRRSRGSSEPAP
jgi:hypothetical protein